MMTKITLQKRKTDMNHIAAVRIILLALIICLFSLTGALASETVLKTGKDQPLSATLSFSAAPLKSMTAIPFTMTLDNTNNKNPAIHSAACGLTMPAMAMPDNHPELSCTGNSCTGTAIFTMAGAWQATFGLILQDGTNTSISFDIELVKMK